MISKEKPNIDKENQIIATTILYLKAEELEKIKFLQKKWNIKTRSKIFMKALNKIYESEQI